jgi:2-hydroxychromene-2-carboxylate isomerase
MSDKLSQRPDETRAKSIAKLYVDPISPYAYFYLKQIDRLDDLLDIRITPILFGAVLAHWGQLGPAEIESKRRHTYQHCVWLARRYGLAFQMPSRHPFNPLSALRLLVRWVTHLRRSRKQVILFLSRVVTPNLTFLDYARL